MTIVIFVYFRLYHKKTFMEKSNLYNMRYIFCKDIPDLINLNKIKNPSVYSIIEKIRDIYKKHLA